MIKLCFLCRKIFDKKNIGAWTRSRILKVSVSEGVVSVSNGQVLVSVSISDDEVSDDQAETPSLVCTTCTCMVSDLEKNKNKIVR